MQINPKIDINHNAISMKYFFSTCIKFYVALITLIWGFSKILLKYGENKVYMFTIFWSKAFLQLGSVYSLLCYTVQAIIHILHYFY